MKTLLEDEQDSIIYTEEDKINGKWFYRIVKRVVNTTLLAVKKKYRIGKLII